MNIKLSFQGGEQIKRSLEKAAAALTKTIVIEALKASADPIRRDIRADSQRIGAFPF